MKWIDDDVVASARLEPETKIAGKIRERMMNCGAERRGPRSLRTLPQDRQRGSWHAGFLYESKHAPRPRSAGGCHRPVGHVVSWRARGPIATTRPARSRGRRRRMRSAEPRARSPRPPHCFDPRTADPTAEAGAARPGGWWLQFARERRAHPHGILTDGGKRHEEEGARQSLTSHLANAGGIYCDIRLLLLCQKN
jgi:hypothetical protein